jgi:hypothetical protein
MMRLTFAIKDGVCTARNSKFEYTLQIGGQFKSSANQANLATLVDVQLVDGVAYAWVRHEGKKCSLRTTQLRNFVGDYDVPSRMLRPARPSKESELARRIKELEVRLDALTKATP